MSIAAAPDRLVRKDDVVAQIDALEAAGGEGTLRTSRTARLHVSSLGKIYFPAAGITKGDLMRYYAEVAPVLLPVLRDRPLILKRYPDGITGQHFFQQNAGPHVPSSVRVAEVDTGEGDRAQRIVGGDLTTLLYLVQLGTIAVHAWQSRLQTVQFADYSTIDLDPGEGVPFSRVVQLARAIKRDLDGLGLHAALKTSGSRGLHIVLPVAPRTTYERSAALAEMLAARAAAAEPRLATLERRLDERPAGTIYVDAQQNARGKSVASAYSAREKPGATVSAPLAWEELTSSLRLERFTIRTMPARIAKLGDLWGEAMHRKNSARAVAGVLASA
ncbi:MAG TPA: non-homologous end-joining DNA ligase [Gemmatimonadaceae bacterium]|nr:non-homologous end-joining DNA ligase [Gemmatimonadaceae bacterium]